MAAKRTGRRFCFASGRLCAGYGVRLPKTAPFPAVTKSGRLYLSCRLWLSERNYHRLHTNAGYPHEIGIFLGYPLYDVIGFIEHRRCLLQGYWNVYRHPQAAKRLFALYDRCISELQNGLRRGQRIEQLLAPCA